MRRQRRRWWSVIPRLPLSYGWPESLEASAIPVPEGVAHGVVRLVAARRYEVPVLLVCPEFTPAQAREWIDGGEVPELAKATRLSYADLDSGHWPMISAPEALADLLAQAAHEHRGAGR
jgi:pimeloyl-ACP methyl ester carboxylesterase